MPHTSTRSSAPVESLISRIVDAIRRRGVLGAASRAAKHIHALYLNWRLATYYRRVAAENRSFDKRHGVSTAAIVPVTDLDFTGAAGRDARRAESIGERLFRKAISHVQADLKQFVFIDYGSGMGKALLLASAYPFQRIIGVELSERLCCVARTNAERFRGRQAGGPIEVVCADVMAYVPPPEPAVFFFYNPFVGEVMEQAIARIEESLRENPRPVRIVYCNPDWAQVIENGDRFERFAAGRHFKVFRAREAVR